MKVTDIISDKINRLPIGYVFTYNDFNIKAEHIEALTKALSRMVKDGRLRKLSPGRFYKPRLSDFGELKPEVYQVVKDLLEQNSKTTGYLTGYSAYNQLGLTSQVSNIIQVGTNELKKNITRGLFKIRFIKQLNKITKENIPLLRILDAIRFIKEIPDASIEQSCKTFIILIKNLNKQDRIAFLRLAKKYNPAARALAGAIFEICYGKKSADTIYKTLNPSSEYKIGISENILPNKQKWNIL